MTLLALIFCFLTFNLCLGSPEKVQRSTHTDHVYYRKAAAQKSDLPQQQKSAKGDQLVERLRRRLSTLPLNAKQALLDVHNEYRSQVALGDAGDEPRAKNMNFLRWDDGLAQIATDYATVCYWGHNGAREQDYRDAVTANGGEFSFTVPPEGAHFAIGENLYITGEDDLGTGQDLIDGLVEGIDMWFSEHLIWDYDTQVCTPDANILPNINVCGHYTQMAWAKTRYVGCGYHQCSDVTNWFSGGANILVCNYYFAGNYIGQYEYEKANNNAEIRSNCEDDTDDGTQHWGGLCSGCPNPDYPDTQTSPSSCDDGLGRSTFAPTVQRPPTPATPSPTVRPSASPTTPTLAPTDRPTFEDGNLEASGFYPFSNINLNGIWLFVGTGNYTYYDSNGCQCNLYLRYDYETWCTIGWYITELAGGPACMSYWTRWVDEPNPPNYPAVTDNQPGTWGSSWPGTFVSIAPPTNAGSTTPQPTTPQPTTPQPTTPQPTTPQPTTPQPTTPQPTTPQPTSGGGGTRSCSYVSGIRYNGVQLGSRINGVATREDCCAYCIADTACVAMKYNTNNNRCWLLSQKDSETSRSNFESADIVIS